MDNKPLPVEQKNKKLFRQIFLGGLVAIFVTLSFWLGFFCGRKDLEKKQNVFLPISESSFINQQNKTIDFSLFWQALDNLKEKYVDVDKIDAKKVLFGAIKGLMESTGDPYTVFFDPEEYKAFNADLEGNFEGIGAEIGIKQGILTIIAPLPDSPAEKAGLRAGDKIIKINGQNSSDFSLDEAVNKIRGPKGTNVTLTIFRNGDSEAKEIEITRNVIIVKSISFELKKDGIAYIKINKFSEDTDKDFNKIASEIKSKSSKGIILDLRNNPGGYLDTAINIASKMIPKNKTILIEENKNSTKDDIKAIGGDILSPIKTVVLINEGSASASEILAAALRENRNNVVLVGKKTFGKGSVQELIKMPENTAAKITVAKWLTPSGKQINETGISPDVEIELTNEDYENNRDPQLEKALEILTAS